MNIVSGQNKLFTIRKILIIDYIESKENLLMKLIELTNF